MEPYTFPLRVSLPDIERSPTSILAVARQKLLEHVVQIIAQTEAYYNNCSNELEGKSNIFLPKEAEPVRLKLNRRKSPKKLPVSELPLF